MSKERHNISEIPDVLLKRLSDENPNFLSEFQSLTSNFQRMNITYKQLEKFNLLPKLEKDEKNDTTAKKQWTIANKLFTDTHYLKGLECYTRSIASASSKEILAAGYANRSLCLYKMKLYKECITDINRALVKNHYPADLRPKLLDRRSRAEKYLEAPERYYQEIPKIPSSRRNPSIQSARNCIEIRQNRRYGRHVVATRDIQIGEVICVEKCYAAMPKVAKLIHCHHCFELCYNPIPCTDCTIALYCSDDCKNKARKSYHKYFCPILLTVISYGLDPLYLLALKILILNKEELGKDFEQDEEGEQIYRSDRYKEVHQLMTATEERPPKDLLEITVPSVFVYHLLKHYTNFFEEIKLNEDVFKEALLFHAQIVILNHLAVYENVQNEKQYDCEMFAIGLYPFCSLFNHSCCPNVDSVQYGTTIVLRATNTIPKGSQLFITYSVQYESFSLEIRREYLKRSFYFTCKCEACEHNWMISNNKSEMEPTLTEDLKLSETEIYVLNHKLGKGDVEIARKFVQHIIPRFKRIEMYEPFGNAWRMKDLMSMCYKAMGNKRRI